MRRLRFFLLEKVVLPCAIIPLRALIRSWRTQPPDLATIEEIAAMPRVIITIWHGALLQGPAFFPLAKPYRRRWVVLVTPSLDGRLTAALLKRLDADSALLADGVRGLDGAGEFVRRVAAGELGVVVVDGPRGPREIVKEGVGRTAAAAGARVVAAGFAASRGLTFRSWDCAHLPAPFARVRISVRVLRAAAPNQEYSTAEIQAAMEDATRDAWERIPRRRARY